MDFHQILYMHLYLGLLPVIFHKFVTEVCPFIDVLWHEKRNSGSKCIHRRQLVGKILANSSDPY